MSSPFEINLLFMFGCVPSTIGKVFHEVLLKISQVFFMEPCILHKDKVSFLVNPFLHKKKPTV